MKINMNLGDEKWIEYEDGVKFKIRPFPMSEGYLISDDETKLAQFLLKKFDYSVIDWQGLLDQNDNEIECNKENKQYIFDHCSELMMWVLLQVNKSTKGITAIEKKT